MNKLVYILLGAALSFTSCTSVPDKGEGEMHRFVSELMGKMTLDEKLGQLNLPSAGEFTTGEAESSDIASKIKKGLVGGLFNIKGANKILEMQSLAVEKSRLGIPLIFGMDVIHGYETIFPIPLGLAATWNMDLVEKAARVAAIEASADGICWTFSPMVDISRDPRWGRVAEGVGEDPYMGAQVSRAFVYGYQGHDPKHFATDEIMGCVKHFALYGAPEGGRDYNTVDMSPQRMFNEYFPSYKAAVDAGVGSVMASFNEINGIPATANKWLMTDVLRKEWGFDGFVVSDYTGIKEMVAHGIGDFETVSARSMEAGVDMDMVSEGFIGTLKESLKKGMVSEEAINRACRAVLEAKYKLGLFQDPYRYCKNRTDERPILTKEHLKAAQEIAGESFVLLKNDHNVLPLQEKGTIAVVGPLANSRENMSGTWCVGADMSRPLSVLEGIRKHADKNDFRVLYAKGSNVTDDELLEKNITMFGRDIPRDGRSDQQMLNEALSVARRSDVVVAVLGEPAERTGESSSCSYIGIPDAQKRLLKKLVATGKPVVLILFAGRPMTLQWESEHVSSILNVWFGGTNAAPAIADVLFGEVNPSGKLVSSFPRNEGQIPVYYNCKNTGRPHAGNLFQKFHSNYLDVANSPLYPFGYGLSYTSFEYSPVTLSARQMSDGEVITASVEVKNTGKYEGKEVVQLYIQDIVGSVTRPVKELKGFKKINLKPGEAKTVTFDIDISLLKFYDYDLHYVAEKGEFKVMIGGSSDVTEGESFELI